MGSGTKFASFSEMPAVLTSLINDLYSKAAAKEVGLSVEDFADILREIGKKYLPGTAGPSKASAFFTSLRVEELALARACAKGSEAAWHRFIKRYREKLYGAARSIAKEESAARELADSLYTDLFVTGTGRGTRVSKLSYYTGRGSLEGWLRTVLAQEYVNRYRKQQRLVSLDEYTDAGVQFRADDCDPTQAPDPRLKPATDEALASLCAEERFILACYYLDGRTLAEIARILGVHESTVSRKLEKIIRSTRTHIIDGLVQRGMRPKDAEGALRADVRELSEDVAHKLMQKRSPPTVP